MLLETWCRFRACCFKVLYFLDSSVERPLVMRTPLLFLPSFIELKWLFILDSKKRTQIIWCLFRSTQQMQIEGIVSIVHEWYYHSKFSHCLIALNISKNWLGSFTLFKLLNEIRHNEHAEQCMLGLLQFILSWLLAGNDSSSFHSGVILLSSSWVIIGFWFATSCRCGLTTTAFNMLPVGCLDGGRAVQVNFTFISSASTTKPWLRPYH